jgi:hypothetical protein
MARKPRAVKEAPRAESGTPNKDEPSPDEIALAYHCGNIGCDALEAEKKLGKPLSTEQFIKAFAAGKASLHVEIMAKMKEGAMQGSEKLLIWYAENILKKNMEAQTGNALIDSMTPEQRRERIKELTKKLSNG